MADSDFVKKRLEKDLAELKKFIDAHFKQREADEQELNLLKERIEKRKTVSINNKNKNNSKLSSK